MILPPAADIPPADAAKRVQDKIVGDDLDGRRGLGV
jgi:hypothetical protein